MAPKHALPDTSAQADLPNAKRRPKMSGEQLRRKRASDRESQRALREKTRNHIAHLETLVQSLRGGQDGRLERLISQLDDQKKEIAKLKSALVSISRIADAAKEALDPGAAEPLPQWQGVTDAPVSPIISKVQPEDGHLTPEQDGQSTNEFLPDATSPLSSPASAPMPLADDYEAYEEDVSIPISTVDDTILTATSSESSQSSKSLSIAQLASSIVGKKDLDGRYWFLAGTLLSYILKTQEGHTIYTANDEDIAIRAIFDGWSAVMERYPLDRGWQWLKELDENLYFHRPAPYRLMHLRNCRLQLLHQLHPHSGWDQALPAFFAPRPSQLCIEHDPLLEYFPWPGFRERVLFSPRKFATNSFMDAVLKNIHFLWPHDIHDLYVKDTVTGLYKYSTAMNRQSMDIRCYTADKEFFAIFPELRQDIPQCYPSLVAPPTTCFTVEPDSPASCEEEDARYTSIRRLTA